MSLTIFKFTEHSTNFLYWNSKALSCSKHPWEYLDVIWKSLWDSLGSFLQYFPKYGFNCLFCPHYPKLASFFLACNDLQGSPIAHPKKSLNSLLQFYRVSRWLRDLETISSHPEREKTEFKEVRWVLQGSAWLVAKPDSNPCLLAQRRVWFSQHQRCPHFL